MNRFKKFVASAVATIMMTTSLPVVSVVQASADVFPEVQYYNSFNEIVDAWEQFVNSFDSESFSFAYDLLSKDNRYDFANYVSTMRNQWDIHNYYTLNEYNVYGGGYSIGTSLNTRTIGTKEYYTVRYNIELSPEYRGTVEEINNARNYASSIASQWAYMSDYDQIINITEWLCNHVEYDHESANNHLVRGHSISSCLYDNLTVCEGYAQAFQAMAESLGLECYIVTSETHAWNAVRLDGNWYYVDATNADQDRGISYRRILFGLESATGASYQCSTSLPISDVDYDHYSVIPTPYPSITTWPTETPTPTPTSSPTPTPTGMPTGYPTPGGGAMINGYLCVDDIYYTLVRNASGNTASVHSCSSDATLLNIPSYVYYNGISYQVTSIEDYAFRDCSHILDTYIPNSVTSIGDGAFYGCDNLKSLVISSNINQLGDYALGSNENGNMHIYCICDGIAYELINYYGYSAIVSSCNSDITGAVEILPAINVGGTVYEVMYIADGAFDSCTGITSIEIPTSITFVGDGAFYDCVNLTEVTIPTALLDVSYTNSKSTLSQYFNVDSITTVNLVGDTEYHYLPSGAFANCAGLRNVTIPEGIQIIAYDAFNGCRNLTSIEIPESVNAIGQNAFYECGSLEYVDIPSGVELIGSYAFYGCRGLQSIEIPVSVTSVGEGAFYGCNLTEITIPTAILDTAYYNSDSVLGMFFDVHGITTVNLVGNTEYRYLPCASFAHCPDLRSVNIPDGIEIIASNAFYGCSSLTSIELPESVNTIGQNAFAGCTRLESLDIPSNVNYIVSDAFWGCGNLTVTYPCSSTFTDVEDWGVRVVVNHLDVVVDEAVNPTETEIGLTEGSHCEECGKVFVAQEEIPVLVHTHTVVIDPAVAPTATEPGLTEGSHCSVCGEVFVEQQVVAPLGTTTVYEANLLGHSLSLDGMIGTYFYYEFSDDVLNNNDSYMKIIMPNGTERILPLQNAYFDYENNAYVFSCYVAAKEMADDIEVSIIVPGGNEDGSDWVSETTYYSVRDYANYILDHASEYAAEVDMVRAMLTYGTYAQLYFGYNTGDLAISLSDPNACSVDWVGLDQFAAYRESAYQVGNRSELVGLDLVLESETTLEISVVYPEGEYVSTGGSYPVIVSGASGSGDLYVQYYGIAASRLDEYKYFDVYIDDELDYSYGVSPFTYAYIVLASENNGIVTDSLKDLMRAMYVYNYYANEYFPDWY